MRWVNSASRLHSAAQLVGTAIVVVVLIVGLLRRGNAEPIQILDGIRGNFCVQDFQPHLRRFSAA